MPRDCKMSPRGADARAKAYGIMELGRYESLIREMKSHLEERERSGRDFPDSGISINPDSHVFVMLLDRDYGKMSNEELRHYLNIAERKLAGLEKWTSS